MHAVNADTELFAGLYDELVDDPEDDLLLCMDSRGLDTVIPREGKTDRYHEDYMRYIMEGMQDELNG